jgi:hypothetical protein
MEPHFFSAEHVHVLLNHLPVTGLAMAILALALALTHRSRKVEIVALILVFVAAASTWPVNLAGQRAYRTIREMTDGPGTAWLDLHMDRAEKAAPAFYALALLAVAAIALPHKWPRANRPLIIATFALALLCEAAGGWIALAGGNVRHPEFRSRPTPESKPDEQHHDAHHHDSE